MPKAITPDTDHVREMIRSTMANTQSAALLHRLDCVLLVAQGRTCVEVAQWFGVTRRTVERWVHAAYAQGLDGLGERHGGGRPAKLAGPRLQQVWQDLQQPPSAHGYPEPQWTGKRLALHLGRQHGIQMGVRSCQRLIASNAKPG